MVLVYDDMNMQFGVFLFYLMMGFDCIIIMYFWVWQSFGYFDFFYDFMVDCCELKKWYWYDQVVGCWVEVKGKKIFVIVE